MINQTTGNLPPNVSKSRESKDIRRDLVSPVKPKPKLSQQLIRTQENAKRCKKKKLEVKLIKKEKKAALSSGKRG